MKKLLLLAIIILASSCKTSYFPTFYEDGSWNQLVATGEGGGITYEIESGCIKSWQFPDTLCTPGPEGPTWPMDTVVYSNGDWFYRGFAGSAWGCIHGYECFTEALANPIP